MKSKTGICPVCQTKQSKREGRIGYHPGKRGDTSSPSCAGVGEQPLDTHQKPS